MAIELQKYARGTSLLRSYPWGGFLGGKALCPDGKVRALKRISETADTFFSIPAAVSFGGKTISGFVTLGTLNDPEETIEFVPTGKNRSEFGPDDLKTGEWRKCESVTTGGKPFFWYRFFRGMHQRFIWDRIGQQWIGQIEYPSEGKEK